MARYGEGRCRSRKHYIWAFEGTKARLRKRLQKMGIEDPHGRVKFLCTWYKRIELEEVGRYLQNHPDTRLVIIDTLEKFAGWTPGKSYHSDYKEISKYNALADRYDIALILVHHPTKNVARDRFDRVNGTTGLTAAVDALITLERSRPGNEGSLYISSRDLEDTDLPVRFNRQTCTWELRETGEAENLTPERQEIVDFLKAAPGPLGLKDLARALGKKKANLANLLKKLVKVGLVEKVRYGKYQLKSRPGHDQEGPFCTSTLSLAAEVTPCESSPASAILGEASEKDANLLVYPKGQEQGELRQSSSLSWQVPGLAQLNMVSPKEIINKVPEQGKEAEPRSSEFPNLDDPQEIGVFIKQKPDEFKESIKDASSSERRKKAAEFRQFSRRLGQRMQEKIR